MTRFRSRTVAVLLVVLVAVTACGPAATDPAPNTAPQPSPSQTKAALSQESPSPVATKPEPAATQAEQGGASSEGLSPFPYDSPESQGISSEALGELADIVWGFFEGGKIVGAELLVIKNRTIVLHEGIGWKDRDEEVRMGRNTLFNIRSMTKPVVGTAAQMLIDEGRLALDDRVAEHLPPFDNEKSGQITIEQLLTHRSGLPLSLLDKWPDYESLQQIAEEAGEHGPDFEPGTGFSYSDTGSDSLGAVLEVVSGVTIGALLEERILSPLGMSDTVTQVRSQDPRTARICSAYMDSAGEWSRYWRPGDDALYPFAMGSQSLYCTPLDYVRFLAFWMDGGVLEDESLLSSVAVQRAMQPVSDMEYLTGFPGLKVFYGQMWMLWMDEDAPEGAKPVLFGHGGSDGTWAWAWPDLDLIVLYCTQSRGQASGIGLEEEIDRLLIHPGVAKEAEEASEEYEPYLGVYTATAGPLRGRQYTVLVKNGSLAVDLPEQVVVELLDPDEEGLWRLSIDESIAVSFERDESGDVVVLKFHQAGEIYDVPRGTPVPEPQLDVEAVQKYLGCYSTEEPGIMVKVLIHNEHLALDVTGQIVKLELFPPDEEGKWALRLNPVVSIGFDEREDGSVESFTAYLPDGTTLLRPRVEDSECE